MRRLILLVPPRFGMSEVPREILDQAEKLGVTVELRSDLPDVPLILPGRIDEVLPALAPEKKVQRRSEYFKRVKSLLAKRAGGRRR